MKQIICAVLGLFCSLSLAACVVVEKDEFNMVDPDDAELVRSVVRFMRGRFSGNAPSVSAEVSLPVHADVDAVKAILINLLDNAAKYAPGAPPEIRIGSISSEVER